MHVGVNSSNPWLISSVFLALYQFQPVMPPSDQFADNALSSSAPAQVQWLLFGA